MSPLFQERKKTCAKFRWKTRHCPARFHNQNELVLSFPGCEVLDARECLAAMNFHDLVLISPRVVLISSGDDVENGSVQ